MVRQSLSSQVWMRECAILILFVFMGCSLLKWQLVMESLQRQLTLRIQFILQRLSQHMQDQQHLFPFNDDQFQIIVTAGDPVEKKATITTYTVYTVKGQDKQGPIEVEKRYSDFDHAREAMIKRWPGCYVPPLPPKKIVGNTENLFIEERCIGLDVFLKYMARLKHLWYSQEFQMFLRGNGDYEKQLKSLPHQSNGDIIRKYDQKFPKLAGKGPDSIIIGRVLSFYNYSKKIMPAIENFKQMMISFIHAKNANDQQLSVVLNYILPKYEESCLSVYCNGFTEGKFIFNQHQDQKLIDLIEQYKKMMNQQNFEELYRNFQLQGREIEAFLEIFKVRDHYEGKLKDLKMKEKDLEVELVKLNAGKQGFFSSIVSKLQASKTKVNGELQGVKEDIKANSFMLDLLVSLMGYFEIPRFRHDKFQKYFQTVKKVVRFQMKFTSLKAKICEHVLDSHNLM